MCNFYVDRAGVEAQFGVDFGTYFADELDELTAPGGAAVDDLIDISDDALRVTARGRLFVRTICMHFDKYLPSHRGQAVFSRTV